MCIKKKCYCRNFSYYDIVLLLLLFHFFVFQGTDAIKGIILDMSQIKDLYLSDDTFKKMTNLRFLKFYNSYNLSKIYLPENIQLFFNKVRYFQWDNYPLQSLPSTLDVEKLVVLNMQSSNIKKLWDGEQVCCYMFYLYLVKLHSRYSIVSFFFNRNKTSLSSSIILPFPRFILVCAKLYFITLYT